MSMILTLLLAVQVISALSIIVLVLLQQGKGADMGSAFGGGSAGSLFGAAGAANFLSRATKWAAVVFFIVTGALAYFGQGNRNVEPEIGIMEEYEAADPSVPLAPDDSADSAVPAAPGADADPAVPQAPASEADTAIPAAPAPSAADAVPAAAESAVPEASATSGDSNAQSSSAGSAANGNTQP